MKKYFTIGFMGLVAMNSAQTDSTEIIISDSTEEISETQDSTIEEEISQETIFEEENKVLENNMMEKMKKKKLRFHNLLNLNLLKGAQYLCLLYLLH